jgi:RNA polymerase primary sigma factor
MEPTKMAGEPAARELDRGRHASSAKASSATQAPDTLQRYFEDLHAYSLLDAKQERAMAQRIEELEIAHYEALLSYAPALGAVQAALRPHLQLPRELTGLRAGPTRATRERAVKRAAARLRELDVTRLGLAEADAKVRQQLADKPAAGPYLARVAKARAAQQAAQNRFMTANLRLVVSLARRYKQSLMPLPDLIQEGNLGLMRAVERFDHRRGFRFSTYASWWIRHGFNRALSDKARLVRVPVHLLDDAQRAARVSAKLQAQTGEAPSNATLAQATGLPEEKVALIQEQPLAQLPASLDRKLSADSDATLLDTLPSLADEPEQALDAARWPHDLRKLLGTLTPIEATILRLRFGLEDGEELTLREVGAKYNLSRERIRQLQEQALDKLRAELARTQAPAEESAA